MKKTFLIFGGVMALVVITGTYAGEYGNADNSLSQENISDVNILDIVYLINYKYKDGPAPLGINTGIVSQISETTAECEVTISALDVDRASIAARGVCWNTYSIPTIGNDTTNNGNGIGSFVDSITNLMANTTYYVRAYVTDTNNLTGYGNEVTFITQQGCGTVIDIEGHIYQTIQIGNQCWMAENLQVRKYSNGDDISNITDGSEWSNSTIGAYCDYDNDIGYVNTYGRLYNWYAVDDSRGLAPNGWHIPTAEDWATLISFLDGNAGSKVKETGTIHWTCANTDATNESGFNALPGGWRHDNNGSYNDLGNKALFWSSTERGIDQEAWYRELLCGYEGFDLYSEGKQHGFQFGV